MKQKFLQSLGTLRRKESENVRYKTKIEKYLTLSTKDRQSDSVSASELRNTKTYYYTDQTRANLIDEQTDFFDEATDQGSGYKVIYVSNRHDFKTPLNSVISDYDNERKFITHLLRPENVQYYDAWIKCTATRFYEIDYAWKKGDHPKRGKFNPDIFIKVNSLIVVVEIKGDEEIKEPSEENKKKNEYAIEHFKRVNANLEKDGSGIRYKFLFLTERNFNLFFQNLREGKIKGFRSEMDVRLLE
jgi:type III restriction enzyme